MTDPVTASDPAAAVASPDLVAAVIIGRNEGQRLVRCLASVRELTGRLVYVDSGSTDGSVDAATAAGAEVVDLDLSRPFTAARARNAGIEMLRQGRQPKYVQLIDGDCELRANWLETATAFLEKHPQAAVASGRLRERHPEASVYNRLCDREWDTPIGLTKACGGIALMRYSALEQVHGFNPALIAGEEPELCVRMRAAGWEIWRLDTEMAWHDAAMTRFSQWWNRALRGGYAAAEGMALHGAPPERHGVRTVTRALAWGLLIPVLTLVLAIIFGPWALLLLLAYPLQTGRMWFREGGGLSALQAAFFNMIGKFAELQGVVEYWVRRAANRPAGLIEYKGK